MTEIIRERVSFKNHPITTIAGAILMLYGIFLLVGDLIYSVTECCPLLNSTTTEILSVIGLGYTFIFAKDTLVDGIKSLPVAMFEKVITLLKPK